MTDRRLTNGGDGSGRLRILTVAACPLPCPRGTPIRIQHTADALATRGHDVRIVTYHLGREAEDGAARVHRIGDVPFYRRTQPGPDPVKLLLLDPMLARRAARVARRQRPDLIHAHHYEGLIVGLIVSSRIGAPVVFDAHTLLESELPSYLPALPGSLKERLGRILDRRLPARSDHVVAVTERLADRLVELGAVRPDGVSVVPNGVNLSGFSSVPITPPGGSSGDGKTVVFAGNLTAYQGLDRLLEAIRMVRERRPATRLLVVSEFPTDAARALVRSLGLTDAVDFVEADFRALPELLARGDVAVSPRTGCDGLPQKILNYMAAGRAIVAFSGCAPGLEHGRNGWLVSGPEPELLSEAILHLLDRPGLARRLGRAAREDVRRRFSWSTAAARLEEAFARVLDGDRPDPASDASERT